MSIAEIRRLPLHEKLQMSDEITVYAVVDCRRDLAWIRRRLDN